MRNDVDALSIEYRPRSEAAGAEELAVELRARRAADVGRGFSCHGPHLDEIELRLGRRSARRYGSQGEQRAALLALLLAERALLLEAHGSTPLMLLDDVLSELDPERRELLTRRLIEGEGQALIAATISFEELAPLFFAKCQGAVDELLDPGLPFMRQRRLLG